VFPSGTAAPVISSVRLPDQQQHGCTARLLRAGDSFLLIARNEPSRLMKRVEVFRSRPFPRRQPSTLAKTETEIIAWERYTRQTNTSRSGQELLTKTSRATSAFRTPESLA
jgi:hypothetical protein